jgi:GH25 family lysozyme M1 (1,4-beta-N-acetylmuramidase)
VRPSARFVGWRGAISVALLLPSLEGCSSESPPTEEPVASTSAAQTTICPSGPLLPGVDTAAIQQTVSAWNTANASTDGGVSFAFMKATQSTDYPDPGFSASWASAKDAGVVRGAYHFFNPTVDGAAQASWFLSHMGRLDAEDLSPVLDVECPTGAANCLGYTPNGSGATTAANFRANMLGWLDAVEYATGRKPIVYTYLDFFEGTGASGTTAADGGPENVDTTGFDSYPLWNADPAGTACSGGGKSFYVPSPWTQAAAWQYLGDVTVAGVGQVDLDYMIGPIDELLGWPAIKRPIHADVNGDGKGDACGRGPDGVTCALSTGSGFGAAFAGPAWSDTEGWRPPAYASTVQLADVTGDGMADVCGRAIAGVVCAPSTGSAFGTSFNGPAWSDATGWNVPAYYATIQFADVTGDGKADACARGASGITCAASTGSGFGTPFAGPAWNDAAGWDVPSRYRTIRFVDLDGDGKADVCGRSSDGLHCALSNGSGFGADIAGPAWSDATGWNKAAYAATIQFPDVNGDGKADACGRGATGITCAPSTGSGFGAPFAGPAWSDAAGWSAPSLYATIVFLDLNGDGMDDVCGRSTTGIECALSTGTAFGATFDGPAWSDAAGWNQPHYYGTLGAADVNGDGKDDLCARSAATTDGGLGGAVLCAPSTGSGFGAAIAGPVWTDDVWGLAPYWATTSFVGTARAGGASDGGAKGGSLDAGSGSSGGGQTDDGGGGNGLSPQVHPSTSSACNCDAAGAQGSRGAAVLAVLGLALGAGRRRLRSAGKARA